MKPLAANSESDAQNNVPHIAIVGGGTAGWMAAATLGRRLNCRITLIESANVPTIGVGEATIPSLLDWLENMEIDEADFLRQTGGTYKLAIRFDNWIQKQHRYWHPFGICGIRIDGIDIAHFWQRGICEGWLSPEMTYGEFSLQRELCEHHRIAVDSNSKPAIANYAFHLDAARLAKYLSQLAQSEGVDRIVADVTHVELADDGSIASLRLSNQNKIQADLFLDCTGFSGVLIERALGVPWIDQSHRLLCDRAVVVRAPHSDQNIAPYTISQGMQAGWSWRIPLEDTMGCGYVFSSNHISSDQARNELVQLAGLDSDSANTRELKMRIGCRENAWHKNCVSMGLSAGFVEPLESTGIFMVQRALDDLVDCLPLDRFTAGAKMDSRAADFNRRSRAVFNEIRDFVLLHYIVSQRDDSEFWRDARSVDLPESLQRFMHEYDEQGQVHLDNLQPVFAEANHHFIMAGAGLRPATKLHSQRLHPAWNYWQDQVRNLLHQTLFQNQRLAANSPSHSEIIERLSPSKQVGLMEATC